jgi:hypothetical protein
MEELTPDSPQTTMRLLQNIAEREECLKRPIIDKNTLIPIGVVLGSITMIITVVWFFASLTFRVEAAEIRLDKLEEALIGLNNMEKDIAVIKSQIDGLIKMISEKGITIR